MALVKPPTPSTSPNRNETMTSAAPSLSNSLFAIVLPIGLALGYLTFPYIEAWIDGWLLQHLELGVTANQNKLLDVGGGNMPTVEALRKETIGRGKDVFNINAEDNKNFKSGTLVTAIDLLTQVAQAKATEEDEQAPVTQPESVKVHTMFTGKRRDSVGALESEITEWKEIPEFDLDDEEQDLVTIQSLHTLTVDTNMDNKTNDDNTVNGMNKKTLIVPLVRSNILTESFSVGSFSTDKLMLIASSIASASITSNLATGTANSDTISMCKEVHDHGSDNEAYKNPEDKE
jgi:hypothetical protein